MLKKMNETNISKIRDNVFVSRVGQFSSNFNFQPTSVIKVPMDIEQISKCKIKSFKKKK